MNEDFIFEARITLPVSPASANACAIATAVNAAPGKAICGGAGGATWSAADTRFSDGGAVGIDGGSLALVGTSGSISIFDDSTAWERMLSDGNCWTYGGNKLQRLDRASGDLDATNWLGTFGLLQVTDLLFTTDDRIRIDGVDTGGGPVVVYVDSSSGELTSTSTELPRMYQVLL